MKIQTGESWNLEYTARQDLSVCKDDNDIRRQGANVFDCLWIFDARRLQNLKERRLPSGREPRGDLDIAACYHCFLYWRRFDALLTPDRFIRLSHDADDFVSRAQQCSQCRHADLTSADKDDSHASRRHLIQWYGGTANPSTFPARTECAPYQTAILRI